jgi:DNA-binding LacI/PurR family transcriptional regulator
VIDELGYEVNLSAKRLRAGRTSTVGLVVPSLGHPYFGELADRYVTAFARRGIHVAIEQSGASKEGELSAISRARLQMYDGVLLSVVGLSYEDVDRIRAQIPIVLLGEQETPPRFDHVMLANTEGARLATGHLLDGGRRRVALVGGDGGAASIGMPLSRYQGWRQAHDERGLTVDDSLVLSLPHQEMRDARERTARAIADGLPFDALFAITDQDAIGALAALHDAGIGIPHDVAVVGFDNLAISEHLHPSLTTIDPSNDWVVEQSVQILHDRIAGDESEPKRLVAPARLVERASTHIAR